MKKVIALGLMMVSLCFQAQTVEVLPKKTFDAKEAENMLAYGNATIKGVAIAREYTNTGGFIKEISGIKHYAPKGTVVLLFPVTDYLKEYHRLKKKYKMSRKYLPVLSREAFSYRVETTVGNNGEFTFERMKPGKYYLETQFNYTGTAVGSRKVGQTSYYNVYGGYLGSSPIYESFKYNYNGGSVERAFVEIKKDGEVKTVKL